MKTYISRWIRKLVNKWNKWRYRNKPILERYYDDTDEGEEEYLDG